MIIPGWLIAVVTFPGVIVHESAHMFFCRLRRVPVFNVCFFRFGNPAGYVIHGNVNDFTSTFLISIGPFLVNSALCVFFCLPAFVPVRVFGQEDVLSYALIWLGVSVGMHSFPSMQDGKVLWDAALKEAKKLNPLALFSLPLVVLIYIANLGSFFWLDYLYGAAIGLGLPELLFRYIG